MRAWWGKRAGESSRCEDPAPTGGMAGRALRGGCDPNAAHDNRNHQGIMRREGRRAAMVCAHGGANGRGNLRVAKTPPLQSALAGMPLRGGYDPNAVITTASLRMPCHPGSLTFFITMRRGRGGHSLRSAPPLPRKQQQWHPRGLRGRARLSLQA